MTESEKFRYTFEHKLLPDMFYKEKVGLLNAILDKGGKFFSDVYTVYAPVGEERTYTEDDFKIDAKCCQYDENRRTLYFLIVTMPEPTVPTLCLRVYFCYEEKTGAVKYCTSEKSPFSGNAICSQTENGEHENLGAAPESAEQEFQKIGNMFLKYIIGNDK